MTPARMISREAKARLGEARATFRARCELADTPAICQGFSGQIAAVLFGGGAWGAYEAGVLLAFQDARVPTHTIVGSSVGSINAASFAAHSDTLVGNAEPLVQSWFDLTQHELRSGSRGRAISGGRPDLSPPRSAFGTSSAMS